MLKKLDKTSIFFGYSRTVLSQIFRHRFLQQTVITFLTDNTFPTLAPSEKEIEDKAYDRKEQLYEYPCHSLHRIPVIKNDNDNRTDNGSKINNVESNRSYLANYYVPINHRNLLFIWILNNKYKANYRINKKVLIASCIHCYQDFPVFFI